MRSAGTSTADTPQLTREAASLGGPPQVQPPLAAPQETLAAANIPSVLPVPTTVIDVVLMAPKANVPPVNVVELPLTAILEPAALDVNAVTVARPVPPATLSVSAELKSRIMMSLSESSNVPISRLMFISWLRVQLEVWDSTASGAGTSKYSQPVAVTND